MTIGYDPSAVVTPGAKLNCHQELVANHVRGRILAIAGPGSGKTRTLTERTRRLVRKGFDPASILCLTFTNKARDEMRARLVGAVHNAAAEKVFISNFHGLCGAILRRFGAPLGYTPRMTICDADDQVDLILQLARKRGQQPTKPEARTLAWLCNAWRENLESEGDLDDAAASRKIARGEINVVREYVKLLRARNQCDFSGLLSETVCLLHEHEDVRQRLRERFRFIQVDEYQDTNRAQNEIVELLAGDEDNVLAVGDADQSIYEWRGASPDAIPQFIKAGERKTGKCAVVKLGTNYRSTPQIVATADALIRQCKSRIAVEFNTVREPGQPVKCARLDTPEAEGEAIAASVDNTIKAGIPPREIAVFFRTNDMSRLIEQSLTKRRIPYQVIGSGSYYDRMEVRDVLSMLRFVCNPRDGIAFHRIANKPARGMGDALVGRIEAYAERHNLDLLTALQDRHLEFVRDDHDKPLSDAALRACRETRGVFDVNLRGKGVATIATTLYERSRYDEWLKARYDEKGEYDDRSRNVQELLNSIAAFARRQRGASIEDYLESIVLYTQGDDDAKEENAVRLMSLHASKGLEFDVVYVIGAEHRILPHEKALADRGERGLDEERRLCYVGFTRARQLLRVTWCAKRQDNYASGKTARFKPTVPSQFLVEAGLLTRDDYQKAMADAGFVPTKTNPPKSKPRAPKRGRVDAGGRQRRRVL